MRNINPRWVAEILCRGINMFEVKIVFKNNLSVT